MKILSVFGDRQPIPAKYSCDGQNINPELNIQDIPDGTMSLVVIVDDPDAVTGVWTHWLVWNILPSIMKIAENSTPQGAIIGKNSAGENKYMGPCPPSGSHRYRFQIYALDTKLALPATAQKADVQLAITGHILDQSLLVGVYGH